MRAIFLLEPIIHIEFEFVGNFETGVIDLTVTNFTELGKKFYTLQPEEIDEVFFEEFMRYLTRQPNHLVLREIN